MAAAERAGVVGCVARTTRPFRRVAKGQRVMGLMTLRLPLLDLDFHPVQVLASTTVVLVPE